METKTRPEVPLQAQKMEVLGRLAGAVIHDLNNLLTVIQLNAGLLALGGLPEEDVLASADRIEEASARAAELTRKVLNFARGQPDETGDWNLRELVSRLARLLEPLVAKKVRLAIQPGPIDAWVHGNRSAIEQAIMNLVLNAVDATPPGGAVTLSFCEREITKPPGAAFSSGRYAGVVVADEGEGIPPKVQARIFEPFFTTKASGTGLGLAIVHRIARLHGGAVEFDTEPGRGTKFRFWLPAAAPPGRPPEPVPGGAAVDLTNRAVLLVEDDEGIRDLARYLLTALGLRVHAAADGEEGLRLWQAHGREIDLLFTDIVLPGPLSGRDLALKILRGRPSLPVLYTSGYSNVGHDQSYLTEANFLPKPFPSGALENAVQAALAHS